MEGCEMARGLEVGGNANADIAGRRDMPIGRDRRQKRSSTSIHVFSCQPLCWDTLIVC